MSEPDPKRPPYGTAARIPDLLLRLNRGIRPFWALVIWTSLALTVCVLALAAVTLW